MNRPPRCPNESCTHHDAPARSFCVRHGVYRAACRSRPTRRYRCKACGTTFSDQTFRADRYDKKPHLNRRVAALLRAGVGLREGARRTGLSKKNYTLKARKLTRATSAIEAR